MPTLQVSLVPLKQFPILELEKLLAGCETQDHDQVPIPNAGERVGAWVARREQHTGDRLFVVALNEAAMPSAAGITALEHISQRSAEVSYWIAEKQRRRGIGLCALRATLMHASRVLWIRTLSAWVDSENIPSRRILERMGFALLAETSIQGNEIPRLLRYHRSL